MSALLSQFASTGVARWDALSELRVLIEFGVRGDLRFLSHHEELRVLQRALIRARWPLAFSRGFNPRPQAGLLLPRNLGVSSDCELAAVELTGPQPAGALFGQLAGTLPAEMHLRRVVTPAPRRTMLPVRAVYEVELEPHAAAEAAPRIAPLLARARIIVQRDYGPHKPARPADIRPYIEALSLSGVLLRVELSFEQQRSARTAEILLELGLPPGDYDHRIHRRSVTWNTDLAALAAHTHFAEGNYIVQGTQEGGAEDRAGR